MRCENVNRAGTGSDGAVLGVEADWRIEFELAGAPSAAAVRPGVHVDVRGGRRAARPLALRAESSSDPHEELLRRRGAEFELERLHVEELARLLGQAADLRRVCSARGEPSAADQLRWHGELAAWRAALADEQRAARLDGARYSDALITLLRELALDTLHWPAPRLLARVAASLHPSARRRAALAREAQREGDLVAACSAYRSALASGPGPRLRRALELELAALDSVGRGPAQRQQLAQR